MNDAKYIGMDFASGNDLSCCSRFTWKPGDGGHSRNEDGNPFSLFVAWAAAYM
jgi:hypothetical protein